MRVVRSTSDDFVVVFDDVPFARVFLAASVLLGVLGVVQLARVPGGIQDERVLGCIVGTGLCLLGFFAVFERTEFAFDRRARVVRWKRRRAFRRRAGEIPFDRIESVAVQSPIGDEGVPSRRVALITRDGEVPLTLAFAPDHGERVALADRIRRFVFPAP